MSFGGSWMSVGVEPDLIVHPNGVYHQRVSVPAADGIAPPGVDYVFVMRTAIQENLAIAVDVAFVKNDEQLVGLHNLPRVGIDARGSHGQAESFRIVLAFV